MNIDPEGVQWDDDEPIDPNKVLWAQTPNPQEAQQASAATAAPAKLPEPQLARSVKRGNVGVAIVIAVLVIIGVAVIGKALHFF